MKQFFLVGAERSGSTMLRLMLDHHPAIRCAHECDFMVSYFERCSKAPPAKFMKLLQADWVFRDSGLTIPSNARAYQDCIESFFDQLRDSPGKGLVGATIHSHFHNIPAIAPEAKYIHLLRDGRPVAASVVAMGWAGNTYYAALYWRKVLAQVHSLQERVASTDWLEIRYEDLVTDAPRKLCEVCTFLGVPYHKEMLDYPKNSTYKAPDPGNAERWRREMSPVRIYLAEMAAGTDLDKLGYSRTFPPARPSWVERRALQLQNRWQRASFRFQRYGAYLVLARRVWRLIGVRWRPLEQRYEAIRRAHIR